LYAYLGLARADHKRQNYDKAKEYCQQALKDDKGAERALGMLVQVCEDAGDTAAAEQARQKLESLNP
jgi:tetratricopeptide (TPR) repeat protein